MNFFPPAILTLAAITGLASASVVNIDFNSPTSATYVGQAAAPDLAGGPTATWNPLTSIAASGTSTPTGPLKDSTGVDTGIGFSLSGLSLTDPTNSSASTEAERGASNGYLSLMRDGVNVQSINSTTVATASGSFTGLVVGATYDLYFYGQGQYMSTSTLNGSASGFRGQNSYFEVNGIGKQTGWDGIVGGDGLLTGLNGLVEGIEYVKFTAVAIGGVINFEFENVVPGGSGNIGTDPDAAPSNTGLGARRGTLNAIQLVQVVPEPSTAILGALGVLGLLARRRR